mmetsp:Transcript_17896/g.30427  ORF Transcript_17896/g.30427 Transcript_17896/m.30427 type:complete len:111 (-) Transcript_17896:879-1211(-)
MELRESGRRQGQRHPHQVLRSRWYDAFEMQPYDVMRPLDYSNHMQALGRQQQKKKRRLNSRILNDFAFFQKEQKKTVRGLFNLDPGQHFIVRLCAALFVLLILIYTIAPF